MIAAPTVSRISDPVSVLNPALIAEYIGYDPELDASQDRVIAALCRAAVELGEQITGLIWQEAQYRIDGLPLCQAGLSPSSGLIVLPITPVFAVNTLCAVDAEGTETVLDPASWKLIPSGLENYRPWAMIRPQGCEFPSSSTFCAEVLAGWNEESLPESLQSWLLLRIATLYDYREDLVTGTITANLPRDHARALLDRWTVRSQPYV